MRLCRLPERWQARTLKSSENSEISLYARFKRQWLKKARFCCMPDEVME
jgi:hypothetical protein